MPAESDPLEGSENSWHQMVSPRTAAGTRPRDTSSVLKRSRAGSNISNPVMK